MNEVDTVEKKLPSESEKRKDVPPVKRKSTRTAIFYVFLILATVFLGAGIVVLRSKIINSGASALSKSYTDAYNNEKDTAHNDAYNKAFDRAEKASHTANSVNIAIENLKEYSNLEVLNVIDTEYIIYEKDDNEHGITSWLEIPGNGTYTVNLKAAEFIIDSVRKHVLVRAPRPEITNITIDYKNVNELLFKNDLLNDSYAVGEDLARDQLSQADLLIKKEFASNQHFYQSAENAAVLSIECLVKELNQAVPDLTVDVEFY